MRVVPLRRTVILVAALAASISAPRLDACSCLFVSPLIALGYSDVAFVGTVIGREEAPHQFTVGANGDTTWTWSGGDMVRYRFVADRGWKGEPFDTVSIYSALDGAACGYAFELGETYLVYAYYWRSEWGPGIAWPLNTMFPPLTTSLCIGNKPLSGAASDLEALGIPDWTLNPAPATMRLSQNHPNPFNPVTQIAFELPRHAYTTLRIYDAAGRLVRILLDRDMPAGSFSRAWDGNDEAGRPVRSGVYLYELSSGPLREARRMTLVR